MIAVVAAGLIIGNFGKVFSMSATTRVALSTFWQVLAFLVNSLLFLLMGQASETGLILAEWKIISILFVSMIVIRSALVYGLFFILNRLRAPVSMAWQHVINWGGLRGSIPIALVLTAGGRDFAKTDITMIVTGVVLLSLLFQGLTIGRLLKWLGLTKVDAHLRDYETLRGRTISLQAAHDALETLKDKGEVAPHIYNGIRAELERELRELAGSTESLLDRHNGLKQAEFEKIAHALLLAERSALGEATRQGILSEEIAERLTHEIDTKLISEDADPFHASWQMDDIPDEEQSESP